MSILVEIAAKADVPVEGVVRVLSREPVSDAVLERVLAVLDDLTPEQTRAVQRFALAALHDVLPRPFGADNEGMVNEEVAVHEGQLTLPAASEELPAAASPPEALVELSAVLRELAEAVRDLRRETDAERRERVDDLAVLIDLITTGWQGLDARLGRIEKQVARIDASRRPSTDATAQQVEPPHAAVVETRGWSSRLPLAAALTLAGALIGTFAVLQLTSNGPDMAALVSARDEPAQTGVGSSSTTGAAPQSTTAARPPAAPARTPTTSSVLGTTVGKTQPTRKRPATGPAKKPATTSAARATPSFKPTRNWAWAPVANARYYSVQFTRGGKAFYTATPTEPRLALPASVVFIPGAYRWVVRPGFGPKAANRLGPPVVNSGFNVT